MSGSDDGKPKNLIGNYDGTKNSVYLQGGRGYEDIFADSGDKINAGG